MTQVSSSTPFLPGNNGDHANLINGSNTHLINGSSNISSEPNPNPNGAVRLSESLKPTFNLGALKPVERLIRIGETMCEFFQDTRGEGFARSCVADHYEVHPLDSQAFKDCLLREYRTRFQGLPSPQTMKQAVDVFGMMARLDGPVRNLEVRVAYDEDGNFWYDTKDARWEAIRVTKERCYYVSKPPPLFYRYKASKAQVRPAIDPVNPWGELEALRDLLNIRDEKTYLLLIAWMVTALLPWPAHPVLLIHGGHGTAKSTLARFIQDLIDPSYTPLLAEPRNLAQWMQTADHRWLITLDNVSQIAAWLSDALCRAVTGDASSDRKLFTDRDEILVAFQRPIMITGIDVVAQRPDLLDRCVLIETTPISEVARKSEADLLAQFEEIRPHILGALLTVVSGVLRELPNVRMDRMPRMADFAKIGVAVERVLNWKTGAFMGAYDGSIAVQHSEAISASPLASRLVQYFTDYPANLKTTWTAETLLDRLSNKTLAKDPIWPKSPRGLSDQLRRVVPNLNAVGFDVQFKRTGSERRIIISDTRQK